MICFCKNAELLRKLLPDERPTSIESTFRTNVPDSELVLYVDGALLGPGSVNELKKLLNNHLDAGLVSGIEVAIVQLVDDLYSPKVFEKPERKGIFPVDVVSRKLWLCRGKVLKELDIDETFFGLSLRRLGYQNYINTNIEVKDAKDNNAEGVARFEKDDLGS